MINLTVVIDNDEALRKLRELQNVAKTTTSSIVTDAERMDKAMRFRPQIDKKAAKEVEATLNALAESMPRSVGAAFQMTEKELKTRVAKLRQEVQQAQIYSLMPNATSSNPLSGIDDVLTHLPDKANVAASGVNNLNFATQQLVREVPAATMGLHMFFLAISNNLPYFADAIKTVREENALLAKQGKPTTSVFKQIVSSIFSWQTALIAGISILTMFGKEIGQWVKSLFKGKEAVDAVKQAHKGLNDAIKENGLRGIGEQVVKLRELSNAYKQLGNDMKSKEQFIKDNAGAFRDLGVEVSNVLDAERLLIAATPEFIEAMRLRAQASAAKELAEKYYSDAASKAVQRKTEEDKWNSLENRTTPTQTWVDYDGRIHTTGGNLTAEALAIKTNIDTLQKEEKQAQATGDALFDLASARDLAANSILKKLDLTPTDGNDSGASSGTSHISNSGESEADKLNDALVKDVVRTQRERDDAEIAAIKDGAERKRAEIQADYERRAKEIDQYEKDLKAAQEGTLTDEQKRHINYLRQANTDTLMAGKVLIQAMQDEAVQEATDAMNEYLITYGTFQERLLALQSKYERKIANAETEGERMALEAERDTILAEYEVRASEWAQELVGKTAEQLTTMADNLQSVLDSLQADYDALDSSDSEEAKQLLQTINMLKAQIKVLKEQLGDASKAVKDGNWADATQVFQNISQAAQDAAEGIEEFDEGLATALRGIANLSSTAINMIGAIKGVMTAFAEGVKGIEKASAILAVVGAAIQAVSALISLFKGSDEVEQTMRQFKELNAELERFRKLAQIDSVEGTIFGENPFGNFQNNLRVMREALSEFNATSEQLGRSVWTENFYRGNHILVENLSDALANLQVKTRDRSDFAEAFGAKDEYAKLGNLYPELFAGGEVSLEGLQKLKESDVWEKLSQRNRDLIDELIADWERYEKATEAVTNYLKDIFGNYGATITDALVDSFKDGTDAVEAFGDAASNVIERLTKDFIYSSFIKDFVAQAEADIAELNNNEELSSEQRVKGLIDILKELESNIQGQQDEVNAALAELETAGYGYEGSASSQHATSKGFQAMSQETGSELNGRFTDIQGQTHRIAEAVEFCRSLYAQNLTHVQSISSTVAMIHNDTALIEQHTRVLGQMGQDLREIKTAVFDGAI